MKTLYKKLFILSLFTLTQSFALAADKAGGGGDDKGNGYNPPQIEAFVQHYINAVENIRVYPESSKLKINRENVFEYWKLIERTTIELKERSIEVLPSPETQLAAKVESYTDLAKQKILITNIWSANPSEIDKEASALEHFLSLKTNDKEGALEIARHYRSFFNHLGKAPFQRTYKVGSVEVLKRVLSPEKSEELAKRNNTIELNDFFYLGRILAPLKLNQNLRASIDLVPNLCTVNSKFPELIVRNENGHKLDIKEMSIDDLPNVITTFLDGKINYPKDCALEINVNLYLDRI
jgi:hypothetical protein